MYKYSTLFRCLLVLPLLSLISVSCKHDNLLVPKPNENIRPAADFIKNNYDFRLFYAALEYTGLVSELNGEGPFTVLAVPDKGFNNLGIMNEAQVRRLDKDSLQHAIRFHILKNRRLYTSDIPTNGVDVRYVTLAGESVYTSAITADKAYFFNGARITRSDIVLANGVLHVMNKMMQYHKGKTVQDYLSETPQYSIFVAGLKKFGLWDELAGKGPFTLFAPTDDVFIAQGLTLETINALNAAAYHRDRLFGAYILYEKHFFVSDESVFGRSGGGNYNGYLRGDSWYLRFGSNFMTTNPGDHFFTPYPELSLWKPNVTPGGLPDRVGMVTQVYEHPKPLSYYDHLCENGIVHQLHGLLALPEDVTK